MNEQEIIYRIALQQVKTIGSVRYKKLVSTYKSASEVFAQSKRSFDALEGIGLMHWKAIKSFNNFAAIEKEYQFMLQNKVQFLAFDQDDYPAKLRRAEDAPSFVFYKGDRSIHNTRVVAIIGTRACSDYGKHVCEQIIAGLKPANPLIVSGLAYGIDSVAHKAAMRFGMSTVGVMATGLDKIYPSQNKKLAIEMQEQGGLLTEFFSDTNPDRENFPLRNRIVAGMADATVVIETPKKGGSIITANLAHSYNRDLFAVPGRVGDKRSEGCLDLIKSLKAAMITCGEDILSNLNWDDDKPAQSETQRKLFVELTADEKKVYEMLDGQNNKHIELLFSDTGLSMSKLSTVLLQLEMNGLVRSLPGKRYQAV